MIVSRLLPSLAGALALCLATGTAFAATAKPTGPAAAIAASQRNSVYDRTTDPVTAAMRKVLASGIEDGLFRSKSVATAITAYYAEQGFVPTWTTEEGLTDRARAVMARIAAANEDGLDASAYRLPEPNGADPVALATADAMLSQAVVAYARDAYGGRVDPGKISDNFGYDIVLPEPADILEVVASSDDAAKALGAFNPPQPEFAALRAKLAEVRKADSAVKPVVVPQGPLLKPGMTDSRVALLRQRLAVDAGAAPDLYDETVVAAVKAFQEDAGLRPDGIVGNGTLAAMNGAEIDAEPLILANMERWRWMPRDLGKFYVKVNVPDFTLALYRGGKVVHTTRVVVGKPTNQTPIFSDQIQYIVVNPVWNVPTSIAVKEMLPAIRANRGNIRGYQVYQQIGGRFRPVDPRFINWNRVDMRKIQIKQPPGERNALGSIKFMFPNSYAVYLHDTPSKSLFQKDYRAYSHGCVRVMDPWAFADALLVQEEGWGAARLKKLVGGPERRVDVPKHIPVHITYFTAWVDGDGSLQTRDDVYGHDKRMEAALGLL